MKTIALVAACAAFLAGQVAKPHLKLTDTTPLTVVGTDFRAHEHVRVVYKADGTWTRRVVATANGRFTARFPVAFDVCTRRVLFAIGSLGSKAYLRFPPPACPPPVAP